MLQATSAAANVGSVSETLTQLVTPVAGSRLYAMHNSLNMGDHNIGFLQQTLTGLLNVSVTLEHKMHHISQNGTAQFIKGSSNNALRDNFEVWFYTLTTQFDGVRQLTEGGVFNKVVGYFKSLTYVTIWV